MNSAVIKTALRMDDRIADVSVLACLMYTWAHTACDDYGRLPARPGWWAMNVVPGRGTVTEIGRALTELCASGVLVLYGNDQFVRINDWFDTQSFQELHMLRAKCPNPDTGECEPMMRWKHARDHFGLRKRAPKRTNLEMVKPNEITVSNADLTVTDAGSFDLTVISPDLTVKPGAIYTTHNNSSTNAGETTPISNEPYWHQSDDDVVRYMAEKIAAVPKYANASRPPNLERVTSLVERIRTVAPTELAIRDFIDNWFDFHSADAKAKFGSGDPVASLRQQIAYYEPKWAVVKKRTDRAGVARQMSESMTDELARITGGTNGG